MLNVDGLDITEVPAAAQQAIADGFAEIIVVSMGPRGAWLVTRDASYFAEAPSVEKKSTVGAGDSMVAGITYYLQKGKSLPEAIRFGVACGSAATMNDGTQLFNKADAERLFELVK
jgi:6-phosphofructokinase 2